MTTKNYLIIEENIVTNIVDWDGNANIWMPPSGSIYLEQSTISAMVWTPVIVDNQITDWILTKQIGVGQIGFIWDGTVLTTNQPKPEII